MTSTWLEVIERANSADLHEYLPLWIKKEPVGLIWRRNVALLQDYGLNLETSNIGLVWHDSGDTKTNTDNLRLICQRMAQDGLIPGWRDELFPLALDLHANVHALVERAALPYFGSCGYGVHVNGLTKKNEQTYMWLAKRALNKPTAPGKLDQIAAGGLPYGISAKANMIKECQEEASIAQHLAEKAQCVGTVSYLAQTDLGIRSDVMFNYDLWLPAEFTPNANDGEVEHFICLPMEEAIELVLQTDLIKFNSALVMMDLFIRHGYITPEQKDYQQICSLLRQREIKLNSWLKNNFSSTAF